jgi:hypothetical protein
MRSVGAGHSDHSVYDSDEDEDERDPLDSDDASEPGDDDSEAGHATGVLPPFDPNALWNYASHPTANAGDPASEADADGSDEEPELAVGGAADAPNTSDGEPGGETGDGDSNLPDPAAPRSVFMIRRGADADAAPRDYTAASPSRRPFTIGFNVPTPSRARSLSSDARRSRSRVLPPPPSTTSTPERSLMF